MRRHRIAVAAIGASLTILTGCSGPAQPAEPMSTPQQGGQEASSATPDEAADQRFPEVLDAELTATGDDFTVAVTISSPYDSPERYADGWRVLTADGTVLAEHELTHDHASEQPFTRTSSPFAIPDDVVEVTVEGRDLANGYGGDTVTVAVPR
ncbi:hypothetical protein [Agrococcus sp. ProA11]|uniref:hypothetical protein n=1 Tax=Agrococcus chionoecetis TaxID=3153752 RepID=UPI00326077E4